MRRTVVRVPRPRRDPRRQTAAQAFADRWRKQAYRITLQAMRRVVILSQKSTIEDAGYMLYNSGSLTGVRLAVHLNGGGLIGCEGGSLWNLVYDLQEPDNVWWDLFPAAAQGRVARYVAARWAAEKAQPAREIAEDLAAMARTVRPAIALALARLAQK
jgi:hypothetical protein